MALNEQHRYFDCSQCLFKQLSCTLIEDSEFEVIRKTSYQMKYQKGETILKQGAKSTGLLYLHSGIVKFSFKTEDQRNIITTIVRGPKLLGGANLFFKDINIFSIVAVEDCDVCYIDSNALRSVALNNGRYTLAMFESTASMFQHSIFNFISLAHNHVNGWIASILLYLWEHVYEGSGYDFIISRKEIAEFAACSHENVINTLSKFKKEGLIELNGKKIEIVNIEALKELSKKG